MYSEIEYDNLLKSIQRWDLVGCEIAVARGADVNAVDRCQRKALCTGSERGCQDICLMLLEKGANIEGRDGDGKTPLIISVQRRQIDIYYLLLKFGADISKVDKFGKTAFIYACENNDKIIYEDLLQRGIDVDQQMGNVLKIEYGGDYENVWKILIEKGADIEKNEVLKVASGYRESSKKIICKMIVQKRNENRRLRIQNMCIDQTGYRQERENKEKGKKEDMCQICLEEIIYICPKCKKRFHPQCIKNNRMYTDRCPNCRKSV